MPPMIMKPNDEERQEELDQDNGSTPFSPPDDNDDNSQVDHPQGDTNVQPEEVYDEGVSGAIEVSDRNGDKTKPSPPVNPDEEGFDREPNEDEV